MKLKHFYILIVVVANIFIAQAQFRTVYSAPYSEELDLAIWLYRNGLYEIEIYKGTEELSTSSILSYGKYAYKDSTIICTDSCNGFSLKFKYCPEYLVANNFYFGIKNRRIPLSTTFSFYSSVPAFVKDSCHFRKTSAQIRMEYGKKRKNNESMLQPGSYKNCDYLTLYLRADHRYEFEHFGFNISKGEWQQLENELILYDEDLKTNFFSQIVDGILYLRILSISGCEEGLPMLKE